EETNEEECKGCFAKLKKKKKKKTKPLKPHNYYARHNKKKEERRQYLKNNKDKLNCLQRVEEKLFAYADLLRSSIYSRTSRKPDGIYYT
ncbi:putative exported protein, partial [Plasmodium gaboni]